MKTALLASTLLFAGCLPPLQDATPTPPATTTTTATPVIRVTHTASATPSTTVAKEKPLPTREELRSKLIGKSSDAVLKILGKPHNTSENSDGKPRSWSYRNKTFNPVSGKSDQLLFVYFDGDGNVSRLGW